MIRSNLKRVGALLLGLCLSAAPISLPAMAAVGSCVVTSSNDSGAGTLRNCLASTGTSGFEHGITITFDPAVTAIQLSSPLVVDVIEGDPYGMDVTITGPVTLSPSLSFATGEADRLFDLNVLGSAGLYFTEVHFSNAPHGAIVARGSNSIEFYVIDSVFSGNDTVVGSTEPDGAAIKVEAVTSNLWLYDNTFSQNTAFGSGGAVHSEIFLGRVDSNGDTFDQNVAAEDGGAIATSGNINVGSLIQPNGSTVFTNNTAVRGGALASGADATITLARFEDNSATSGGAVFVANGSLQINSSLFLSNSATQKGGAVQIANGYSTVTRTHFESNSSTLSGGSLHVSGDVGNDSWAQYSSFVSNTSGADGGAIATETQFKIGHSTLYSNRASGNGGALAAATGAQIAFSTFLDNSADNIQDVSVQSGVGATIGSVYASSVSADVDYRVSPTMANTHPGNFSTASEGIFTNSGNYQAVGFESFNLSAITQFTTERCAYDGDLGQYVDCAPFNTTKGFIPAADSVLLGKVSESDTTVFATNAWIYWPYADQRDASAESLYTAGSVYVAYTGGEGEGGGGGEGEGESGDVPVDSVNPNVSVTSLSKGSVAAAGDSFVVFGKGLNDAQEVYIGSTRVSFVLLPDGTLRVTSPVLTLGQYDLRVVASDGEAVLLKALWVVDTIDFSTWTKRSGDSIKIYAKNVIGVGKVQIFVDGRELAWVNAIDATDPKLRTANGFHYLVRTVALKADGSKTRFEVKLNGERVRRNTYTIYGN